MNAVEAKNLWYRARIFYSNVNCLGYDKHGNYGRGFIHLSDYNCVADKENFLTKPCHCIYFDLETGEARETAHLPYDPDSECAKWRTEEYKKRWRIAK